MQAAHMQIIPQPISYPTVRSASHSSPFLYPVLPSPLSPLFLSFAFIREPLSFSQQQPAGNTPCSNKSSPLSMEVMITSLQLPLVLHFCNTIWPLWALVSPI